MSRVVDVLRFGWKWLREHALFLLFPVAIAVFCPPTRVPDLAPAMRAAVTGHAIAGTFRLDEYQSGMTGRWWGEFRSDDGRTIIAPTDLDGVDAREPKGKQVRAFVITRQQVFWGPPTAYTGKNANYIWVPIVSTLYWSGLTVIAAVWLRIVVRRRQARRAEPRRPHLPRDPCGAGCSCAGTAAGAG